MPQKPKYELKNSSISDKDIGENITKFRKSKGLTQVELAEKIGISQILLSHYERGRSRVSAEMVIQLAIALNVPTDKILGLTVDSSLEPVSPSLMQKIREIDVLYHNLVTKTSSYS